jgi:alcohol dehydrogenase
MMVPFDFILRTRLVFGAGAAARAGELARELGARRSFLVADPGIVAAGHVDRVSAALTAANIAVFPFHDFQENPDSAMARKGAEAAREAGIDSLVAVGGGSSLDCAKAINFVLTNGGHMREYRGYGRATTSLLPMIALPTTAGTGSEAQSYAIVSDEDTHEKMACGDPTAAFRVAVLDPDLTVSQPATVTASAGYDALSHAVESYVTTKRTAISEMLSREAWRLLAVNYERVLAEPADIQARAAMQLGAFLAGAAIEQSMLGASHACANPLTRHYGISHAHAIAMLLPHVVRWNDEAVGERYRTLTDLAQNDGSRPASGASLADLLARMAEAGRLPRRLAHAGVTADTLPLLSREAAGQWTGAFNPRPFSEAAAMEIYRCAY